MSQPIAHRANVAALIPCYFEEKHIRQVAGRAMKQLDLVLAVDDGSTDLTFEEALASGCEAVRHEKNAGKGAAIKTGLKALLAREGVEFILIPGAEAFLTASNDGTVRRWPLVSRVPDRQRRDDQKSFFQWNHPAASHNGMYVTYMLRKDDIPRV